MKSLVVVIIFFSSLISAKDQTPHEPILYDPKVKYYDLEGRLVQSGFLKKLL